ncbi:hypothetical protein H4R34_003348, partial [Dimargaris verticillata]
MKAFAFATALLAIVSPLLAQPSHDKRAPHLKRGDLALSTPQSTFFHTCVEGTMRCDAWNSNVFYVCNFNKPVKFNCGP